PEHWLLIPSGLETTSAVQARVARVTDPTNRLSPPRCLQCFGVPVHRQCISAGGIVRVPWEGSACRATKSKNPEGQGVWLAWGLHAVRGRTDRRANWA